MAIHTKTPVLSVHDPRRLLIRKVEHWRVVEGLPTQARIHRTAHDAAGRAVRHWDPRLWTLQHTDPLAPANLALVHSLGEEVLRSDSVDAGRQLQLPGVGAQVLFAWNSRGSRRECEYDSLMRPTAVFEEGESQSRCCTERFAYGRPDSDGAARNRNGQLIRHDDPAGSVLFGAYALGRQCIESTRRYTQDPATPDWPEPIDEREWLLEPGAGATTRWRFAAPGQMLEQADARGNRHSVELTIDGRLRAGYLQMQGQSQPQRLVSGVRYNADGQVEREVAGNDVLTTLTFEPEDGRLKTRQARTASGTVLQHLIYEYDPVGNIISIEDRALPVRHFANQRVEPVSRLCYDSLYQLSEASGWEAGAASKGPESSDRTDPAAVSNYRQTYRYDAGGNLLTLTHAGVRTLGRELQPARYSNRSLPYRNGLPPTEEQIAAAFDASGNLLQLEPGRTVQWDLRNRLSSVSPVERAGRPDDREVYVYGADGQRVRKLRALQTNARSVITQVRYLPGLELRTLVDGTVLEVVKAQAGLNPVQILHWTGTPPEGRNDLCRYGFTDHLGSVSLELGEDARIISQETYYPFGETAWSREPEVSHRTVRHCGKERDATGLYHYGHRYYIPWLQRWMNPDPMGYADGANLYRAALNNPVTYLDDDGAITRKRLANGLWEPVISTGAARIIAGASPFVAGKPERGIPALGEPARIDRALQVPEFSRVEVSTAFLDPTPGRYSNNVVRGLANKAGGGAFIFTMDRLTFSGVGQGVFNVLRIVDIARNEMPDTHNAVSAFWAPQGGYVDIPLHPARVDPDHVFTPGFSGCSLTVEQLNDNVLRVRHVEGGKEDEQFNRLPQGEHGLGLGAAMEYADYGYAEGATGQMEEVTTGFAFMKYDRKQFAWNIHYQSIQGASGIERYQPGASGFFTRSNAVVSVYASGKVRKTMSRQVMTAGKRTAG